MRIMPLLASAIRSLPITADALPMKTLAAPPMYVQPITFRLRPGGTLLILRPIYLMPYETHENKWIVVLMTIVWVCIATYGDTLFKSAKGG